MGDTSPYIISIVYPTPAQKEKWQFSQGVCKKLHKMLKSVLFLLQKSVKAAFLSRMHKFGVQFFLHIDGLHQRCAKVGVALCKKLQYDESTERVLGMKARKNMRNLTRKR